VIPRAGWIETYRGRVAPAECDYLGHMNIQFYVARISDATATLNNAIGFTAGYLRSRRRALVTVHQDISYIAEVKAGDLLVMHSGVPAAESKKVRVLHRLTRAGSHEPVMTANVLMVAMDLERRRATAIDEAILTGMRKHLVPEQGS
jgi:acyl-CoA thioester hydrolase